jgi:glycosyltransferase involved in cell wall biosynthesis
MNLSAVVLTFNEQDNLPRCLESLGSLRCRLYLVDSGSTDATLEIGRQYGAKIVTHPFETHTRQWQWALENLPLTTEWVLALDADQSLTPDLAAEIVALFSGTHQFSARLDALDGIYLNRRQVFRGRWIKHGGYYPKYLLKIFRRGRVLLDHYDFVDHHFYVRGATVKLQHDLVERNSKEDDIAFWITKHVRYANLLAEEEYQRNIDGYSSMIQPSWFGSPDQRTLQVKTMWSRMPMYVRPVLYFLYRYFLRLGFLDGKAGFIFHFLQALWFRLLVDIYLEDRRTLSVTESQRRSPDVSEKSPSAK